MEITLRTCVEDIQLALDENETLDTLKAKVMLECDFSADDMFTLTVAVGASEGDVVEDDTIPSLCAGDVIKASASTKAIALQRLAEKGVAPCWRSLNNCRPGARRELCTLLLDSGLDMYEKGNYRGWGDKTEVLDILHDSLDVMSVIVERGYDLNSEGASVLHDAASRSSHQQLWSALLARGFPVDFTFSGKWRIEGTTGLLCAISRGDIDFVEFLLQKGADVTLAINATSCFQKAVDRHGDLGLPMCELLLAHGGDINGTATSRETPLVTACRRGYLKSVKWMLRNGAGVNRIGTVGVTSLAASVSAGRLEIFTMLLEHDASIDVPGSDLSGVLLAPHNGLTLKPSTVRGQTPLMMAARMNALEFIEAIVEKGASLADVDSQGTTALLYAARYGMESACKMLVALGADVTVVDANQRSVTHLAAAAGWDEVCTTLLGLGAPVNPVDTLERTPLLLAARAGHHAACSALLAGGAEVDKRDANEWTPLHHAAINKEERAEYVVGFSLLPHQKRDPPLEESLKPFRQARRVATITALLDNGGDVDARDSLGRTPLMHAARSAQVSIVQHLAKSADIKATDNKGWDCLIHAACVGSMENATALLELGASLTHRTPSGQCCLMFAAGNGHEDMCMLLIGRGASIRSRDNKGRTPYWFASQRGHRMRLLELPKRQQSGFNFRNVKPRYAPTAVPTRAEAASVSSE